MDAPLVLLAVAALVPAAVQVTWPALAHRLLSRRPAPLEPTRAASLSVLVPVCGEEPGLEDGLLAVLTQSWPGHDFEVCIVAAHADDPALAVARRVLARVPGRGRAIAAGVPAEEPGKAAQLAAAASAAGGAWIVLLDSDARLPDELFLRRFCAPLAEAGTGLVTCVPVHRSVRSVPSRLLAATLEADLLGCFAMLGALGRLEVASGACLALRREVLQRSGGLNAMRGRLLMDTALARAVRAVGGRARVHGEPVPVESGHGSLASVSAQSHRWLAAILRGLPLPAAAGFAWLRSGSLLALLLALAGGPPFWALGALAISVRLGSVLALRRSLGHHMTASAIPVQFVADAAAGLTWIAAALDPRVTWRGRRWRVGAGARLEPGESAP